MAGHVDPVRRDGLNMIEKRDSRAIVLMGAINLLPNPVFIKNKDHIWVEVNDAFCTFLGMPREDLIGKSDFDFAPKELAQQYWDGDDTVLNTKQADINIEENQGPDGTMRWVEVIKSYFEDEYGEPYVIGLLNDVTEQKAREDALAEAVQQAKSSLALEQARRRQSRLLSEFDEWLHSCKSIDELLRVLEIFMPRLLPGSAGQLFIYSNSRDVLDGQCRWSTPSLPDYIHADDCWALRRGRPFNYGHGEVDILCRHVEQDEHSKEIGEYLCIPILAHGDTVGLMHIRYAMGSSVLKSKDPGNRRRTLTHQFATQCGEHISLAIANVKLRDQLQDQSRKDPLTGLANRRYFLDCFRSAIHHAQRSDGTLSLLTLDADHFKKLNDLHGHDAGDHALRMISKQMQDACDGDQIACRLGGEEFAILLPGAALAEATAFAERLRADIGTNTLTYAGAPLPNITVSLGVSEYPTHGSEPQVLLRQADRALYRAKSMGRDTVCVAELGGAGGTQAVKPIEHTVDTARRDIA